MNDSQLQGRRYVCLVRCSTDEQTDTSIPDQLAVLHAFAAQRGMIDAGGAIILDGVSGSRPGARTDIEQIISRKVQRNDFDVLLVQDFSRLTRSGIGHGQKIEYDLNAAGIDVLFASGTMPEGDHAGIVKSVEYFAAQQYAKSISFAVARGQMSALLDGRMVHCLRPPYAIDRLYLTLDGRPLHVLRNRSDGSQVKLDAETGTVLETYPRPQRGHPNLRYRKQKSERVVLIAGDPDHVAVVRQIFRRRLVDGWGHWRIATELNDQGICSPNGRPWGTQTIKVLLRNTVYVGKGIANRRTHSVYHARSRNAPVRTIVSRQEWATRKQPKVQHRPQVEWVEQNHPALVDLLGSDLRVLAVDYQSRFLVDRPPIPAIRPDKHVDSKFILKGVLTSKQGNHAMTGRTRGTKEKPYRYYHISSACAIPSSDGTMRQTFLAEPIERAVLKVVRDTLMNTAGLELQLRQALLAQQAAQLPERQALSELHLRRDKLSQQIEFVLDELSDIGKVAARSRARQLEAQLHTINARIAEYNASKAKNPIDLSASAATIAKHLCSLATNLEGLPPVQLRSLLRVLIAKLQIDMETREIELELALPSWAATDPHLLDRRLGLDDTSLQKNAFETQGPPLLLMATFLCSKSSKHCFDCRRAA